MQVCVVVARRGLIIIISLSVSFSTAPIGTGTMAMYSWAVVILRWSALSVSPELIGTSSGLIFAVAGLLQITAELTMAQVCSSSCPA